MSVKAYIYIIVALIVIWALDSININAMFKKNKILQSRIIYLIIAFSLVYLFTNFIWDFFLSTKI